MAATILIVDDEESIRTSVAEILSDEGYRSRVAGSGEGALGAIAAGVPDLVLLDVSMPGRDGIEILEQLSAGWPELPVIMMSGYSTIELAVRATHLGAYDFLEKPLSCDKLLLAIRHGLEQAGLRQENRRLREEITGRSEMIGNSRVIRDLMDQIAMAAPTDGWVLITGENGTGKELVASRIHAQSKRAGAPFVAVSCAAIPDELIESELFGHEKGAFTGAIQTRAGKFEIANGGTIFLDEIGDMSLMTQAKILRILQEHCFERVGGSETIQVDVRVIAATNKDLERAMAEGAFREDLYYRLNVIPFHVAPLRERHEDIPLLLDHYLKLFSAEGGGASKQISAGALQHLVDYSWPGNVRELRNIVERLVLMTPGARIEVEDLPKQIRTRDREAPRGDELSAARGAFEREFLLEKLRVNDWNISRTAGVVGLARESLSRKLRALGIDVERGRSGG